MSNSVKSSTTPRRKFRADTKSVTGDPTPNPLQLTVNASGGVSPSGNGALMSKSGNGQPNAAYWQTASKGCTLKLPVATWVGTPDPNDPTNITVVVAANSQSGTYTLQPNGPTGDQAYGVTLSSSGVRTDSTGGDQRPSVVVNP